MVVACIKLVLFTVKKLHEDSTMIEYTVAVLGATGLVGQKILEILEERNFPVKMLKPLASSRTAGETIVFQGKSYQVEEAKPESFEGVDIVLASAGASISEKLVPEAVKRGAVVIDNTSFFRLHDDVPLVVAGCNDDDLKWHQGIIANPNCSTAQLIPVFKKLHELGGLKRVVVSTYQSASGAGKEAIDELLETTKRLAQSDFKAAPHHQVFSRPLAFNLIAQIDVFMPDGYTKEEFKVIAESRKILHLPDLKITATAVRVPVLIGHSEAVTIDFEHPISPEEAISALKTVPEIKVLEKPEDFPTPKDAEGIDPVLVGRIRRDTSNPETGLNLWVVADNLRIGAALNAVKIAEKLHSMNLVHKTVTTVH
jgi:aspartate-semialdehyde dehydrogenase